MPQFISEDHLGTINAEAELDAGVLTPWRTDINGKQWYRRELPALRGAVIKGVTEPSCTIGSEPAAIESIAEETECEVFGEDTEE